MSETTVLENSSTAAVARAAGIILIAVTILEVLAMAHHPSVHAHDLASAIDQLGRSAGLSAVVHGTLIALMLIGFCCLTEFSVLRGLHRPAVRAGLVAYAVGVVAMVGAAIVDGFVTGQLAARLVGESASELQVTRQILLLCETLNQALAQLGTAATSVGIAAWSLSLLRSGAFARVLGIFGVLTGASAIAAILFGVMQLDVHRMMLVLALEGVWMLGAGVLLVRRTS